MTANTIADEIQSLLEKLEVKSNSMQENASRLQSKINAYVRAVNDDPETTDELKLTPYRMEKIIGLAGDFTCIASQALPSCVELHKELETIDRRPQKKSGGGGGK